MIKVTKNTIAKIYKKIWTQINPTNVQRLAKKSRGLIYGENSFEEIIKETPKEYVDFSSHLEGQYKMFHKTMIEKELKDWFNGSMAKTYEKELEEIIIKYEAKNWFDYGAGNSPDEMETFAKKLSVKQYEWFDIGVDSNEKKNSTSKYDLVTSFDVLEHVHTSNIPQLVADLFAKTNKVLLCTISSRVAAAHLPDGNNAHITIFPVEWWAGVFHSVAVFNPGVKWIICVEGPDYHGQLKRQWASNPRSNNLNNSYVMRK